MENTLIVSTPTADIRQWLMLGSIVKLVAGLALALRVASPLRRDLFVALGLWLRC